MSIINGLIGLGIVIFIHETGHFIAAKLSGIEVEAFSLGWGLPFFRYQYRGTEYRLSVLPFGGYCKLKGEQTLPGDDGEVRSTEEGSLFSVPPWKRIATFAAGPFSNLLFSIFILSIIWFAGFSTPTFDNKIALVSDYSYYDSNGHVYPADTAGLQTGDRIISIDGQKVRHYRDIQEIIGMNPEVPVSITVERNGTEIVKSITPELNKEAGTGMIGVSAWIDPVVSSIVPSSAASAAGLQVNDRILSVDGTPVTNQLDFYSVLKKHPLSFSVTVQRDTAQLTLRMIPGYNENGQPELGFSFAGIELQNKATGPLDALMHGTQETFSTLVMTVKSLTLLFRGIDLNKAVSGPIRITYMVGQVASYGFSQGIKTGLIRVFQFLSLLSVALFVMNLLPIPALDGGLILLNIIEIILRRKVSFKFYYRYQIIGFAFILTLLVLTTFSDIFYFFTN